MKIPLTLLKIYKRKVIKSVEKELPANVLL